jgi:2-polyprenyl-3-methyl-5-hydroxy-6-metoxy-1,4-benzoquinol methylase
MTTPSPDLFFEMMFGWQRAAALKAAVDLDVFTVIGGGANTATSIAARCRASERGIRILCDSMTIAGLLAKHGDRYALTADSSTFLSKTSPAYLGSAAEFLYAPEMVRNFDRLAETIRLGSVAPEANTVADENPMWVQFARAMAPMMVQPAHAMANVLSVDTAGPMRVLDIAAGHGIFGIVVAQRNPAAEIVAVDWAPVLAVATQNAQHMGVGARHRVLNGDAFDVDYGMDFDVVLLANFLHHFDPQTCIRLLKKSAVALKPAGRAAILEFVPNDDRITPALAATFSLTMLGGTDAGDAYTLREHTSMLHAAGFANVQAHPLQGPQTIITASKESASPHPRSSNEAPSA